MSERKYRTNLNCGSCVAAVAPALDGEPRIKRWGVDTRSPDKLLTVEGEDFGTGDVEQLVASAGFKVLGEVEPPRGRGEVPATAEWSPADPPGTDPSGPRPTYYPIVLLFGLLMLGTGLLEIGSGTFDPTRAMNHFMGGFFLAFAFFKLLDVPAFADAFAGYDVVAGRWRAYGYVYPFVELLLGAAYLSGFLPVVTNAVTLIVMSVGTVGVVRTLLARRKVRCACLGAVFNLPMSYVTLAEDTLMAGMAAAVLLGLGRS